MNLSTPRKSGAGVKSIPVFDALANAVPPLSVGNTAKIVNASKSASVSLANTFRSKAGVSKKEAKRSSNAIGALFGIVANGSNFVMNPSLEAPPP